MVRNIISNQDVDDIVSNAVTTIEETLAKNGVPHVEPVFVSEHVNKIGEGYEDSLQYDIVYKDGFDFDAEVSLNSISIFITGTSDNPPKCHIRAKSSHERVGMDKYICAWKGDSPSEIKDMLDEMFDDSVYNVYKDTDKLKHLLYRVRCGA